MRTMFKASGLAAVSLTMMLGGGCGKSGRSSLSPSVTYSQVDMATAGSVKGAVHFDGIAPKRVEIDMAQDPACAMAGGKNLAEGVVENGTGLANVYVYVSGGLAGRTYAASTKPVILDQKGCRYIPHVIAAQVGQPIEFRNSDATMHNIHMEPQLVGGEGSGNQPVDISQPPNGGTTRHAFTQAQAMIPVRCNNHPWMQAFINVAPDPFFAVTDFNGKFTIRGLPPGTYTLTAIHEQLGTTKANVTVTARGASQAEFHFAGGSK